MKEIKGYQDYFISENGIVYKKTKEGLKEKAFFLSHNGYKRVALYRNGKCKKFFVHRLVAETYIDNPLCKNSVDHIDHDRLNNNVNNLRWISIERNSGEPKAKLNKKQADYIRTHYKRGNGTALSEMFDIDLSMVCKIAKNKAYKWQTEEVI